MPSHGPLRLLCLAALALPAAGCSLVVDSSQYVTPPGRGMDGGVDGGVDGGGGGRCDPLNSECTGDRRPWCDPRTETCQPFLCPVWTPGAACPCDPVTGNCISPDPCAGMTLCTPGQLCDPLTGACITERCAPGSCSGGYVCDAVAGCIPDQCESVTCMMGMCDPLTGACSAPMPPPIVCGDGINDQMRGSPEALLGAALGMRETGRFGPIELGASRPDSPLSVMVKPGPMGRIEARVAFTEEAGDVAIAVLAGTAPPEIRHAAAWLDDASADRIKSVALDYTAAQLSMAVRRESGTVDLFGWNDLGSSWTRGRRTTMSTPVSDALVAYPYENSVAAAWLEEDVAGDASSRHLAGLNGTDGATTSTDAIPELDPASTVIRATRSMVMAYADGDVFMWRGRGNGTTAARFPLPTAAGAPDPGDIVWLGQDTSGMVPLDRYLFAVPVGGALHGYGLDCEAGMGSSGCRAPMAITLPGPPAVSRVALAGLSGGRALMATLEGADDAPQVTLRALLPAGMPAAPDAPVVLISGRTPGVGRIQSLEMAAFDDEAQLLVLVAVVAESPTAGASELWLVGLQGCVTP